MRSRQQSLRLDLEGDGIVVAGLRLLHVRDRDQADLETPLRLLELPGHAVACRDGRREIVFGGKNVEVGGRDTQDEILLRRSVVGLGAHDALVGLLQRLVLAPIENRLGQAQLVAGRIQLRLLAPGALDP